MARREDERINEYLLNWRQTGNHMGEMKTYAVARVVLKGGVIMPQNHAQNANLTNS